MPQRSVSKCCFFSKRLLSFNQIHWDHAETFANCSHFNCNLRQWGYSLAVTKRLDCVASCSLMIQGFIICWETQKLKCYDGMGAGEQVSVSGVLGSAAPGACWSSSWTPARSRASESDLTRLPLSLTMCQLKTRCTGHQLVSVYLYWDFTAWLITIPHPTTPTPTTLLFNFIHSPHPSVISLFEGLYKTNSDSARFLKSTLSKMGTCKSLPIF